jgi:hypothetical protein
MVLVGVATLFSNHGCTPRIATASLTFVMSGTLALSVRPTVAVTVACGSGRRAALPDRLVVLSASITRPLLVVFVRSTPQSVVLMASSLRRVALLLLHRFVARCEQRATATAHVVQTLPRQHFRVSDLSGQIT